jgi:hypothetical protein
MQDLVNEMTHINPVKRPLIEDVVAKFSYIRKSLSEFKLRSSFIRHFPPRETSPTLPSVHTFVQGCHSRAVIKRNCGLHDGHVRQ